MSKKTPKQAEAKSTPNIYQGLDVNKDQKTYVIEDVHFLFYIFDNAHSVHIIKEAIQKRFDGLGAFMELSEQTILTYHENLFKQNPPKGTSMVHAAQYTWAKIISICVDRRTTKVPVSANGRKSTIGLCEYRTGTAEGDGQLKTPQAKACLKLFREVLASDAATVATEGTDRFVTEEVLRQYIIDHASELHTRQDPWRIFQYYRPALITEKLITRK